MKRKNRYLSLYVKKYKSKVMYKSFFLIIVTLFLCSCTNKSLNKISVKQILKIEHQIKTDSTKGEDFLSFFDQFKKDTLFQQERLCLPFKQGITVEDFETGGTRDSTITGNDKKEWLFCSFLIRDSVKYFDQNVVVKHDTVEVTLRPDPKSYYSGEIDARFVRKKGKWFNYYLWITR